VADKNKQNEELELDEEIDVEPEEDEDESDETASESDTEDGVDEEGEESEQGGKVKPSGEKMVPQSRVNQIVKDRLAANDRRWQTKLDAAVAQAKASLPADATKALEFWNYLKANPRHSAAINQFLSNNPWENHPREEAAPKAKEADLEATLKREFALRDTLAELRSDEVFKKHEAAIREYAEENEFDLDKPRDLKAAYKAWRGENARLLAANARLQGQRDAKTAKEQAKGAKLQGASGAKGGGKQPDYRKLSDAEILKRDGLKLFTSED
jgi:hypothetical protein